jgi:hypothetical protein
MAVQVSKSNNIWTEVVKKEESQGQKNSGLFLTDAPLTKTCEISVLKKSNEPMISNGTKFN